MRHSDQPSSIANPDIDKDSLTENVMLDTAGMQTNRLAHEQSRKENYLVSESPRTGAETLLRALRNVIITLVPLADGEYKRDVNQHDLGSEGEEFVIALQKFMSSFLRSQQGPVGGVELELEVKGTDIVNAGPLASNTLHDDFIPKDVADIPPDTVMLPDRSSFKEDTTSQEDPESIQVDTESSERSVVASIGSMNLENTETYREGRLRLLEKLRNALRKHVFNVMPIRLLCFKPYASKLQITLVERGAFYADIESKFRTNIYNPEFFPLAIDRMEGDNANDSEIEAKMITRLINKYSRYAVSSHTWLRGSSREITYGDWNGGEFDAQQPGYRKLLNFCKVAWEDHGVIFGWMDTICINKESSAELDESIRSMYKWYSNAYVCITYLAETLTVSDMPNDTWFTRGWTLQELIAPSRIKFYNTHWNKLGHSPMSDREDSVILKQIEQATTITYSELTEPMSTLPISRRMQMAAKRQVTREEDSAYSLMGIFDVSIAIAYGEGAERAFSRLIQEIFNPSNDIIDMFNWAGPFDARISSLLPSTLQGYLHRSSYQQLDASIKPIEPLMLTHVGLRVAMVLMGAISIQNPTSRYNLIGDYGAIVSISPLINYLTVADNMMVDGNYSVLDARISEDDGWQEEQNVYQLTLGILNVGGGNNRTISIPKHCLAVGLQYFVNDVYKIPTEAPIVFSLHKRRGSSRREPTNYSAWDDCYYIERSELSSHGMKLVTLYL